MLQEQIDLLNFSNEDIEGNAANTNDDEEALKADDKLL
jgi:hypothetical protein